MRRRGQVSTEHAILLGVVIAALVGIQLYAKRGLQAGLKTSIDRLSPFRADRRDGGGELAQSYGMIYETGERRNRATAQPGAVIDRQSAVVTDSQYTQQVTVTDTGSGHLQTTTRTTESAQSSGRLGSSGHAQTSTVAVGLVED